MPRWYAAVVATSYLLALLDARPTGSQVPAAWLASVLEERLHARVALVAGGAPGATDTSTHRLRGWSVASVVGNETFVQARPIVRDAKNEPVEDVLRTPAPCTLASFHVGTDDERFAETHPSVRLARFRRWIGTRAEAELDTDTRRRMREEIPDFLARSQTVNNDAELVFLRFLAALHAAGALGAPFATAEEVRRALRTTAALLGDGPVNVMVSDGRTLGVIHRGGTMYSLAPPLPVGRMVRPEDEARAAARHNLLWYDPDGPPELPPTGAERVAEGIFTIECLRPRTLARE
jgi:hypothetical protein